MKQFNITVAVIFGIMCSWIKPNGGLPNINTYHMCIGKKLIFSTTMKNNKLGDMVVVLRKEIKPSDTLYANVFICGTVGDNAKVVLTIKDEEGNVIKTNSHITQRFGYSEKIAINDIFSSPQFDNNEMMCVFFSIDNKKEKFNTSFLLGKIKLK